MPNKLHLRTGVNEPSGSFNRESSGEMSRDRLLTITASNKTNWVSL